jgi:hypothetical protein
MYDKYYLVYPADVDTLTVAQLQEEVDEYDTRVFRASREGYGISSKEFVRAARAKEELMRRLVS